MKIISGSEEYFFKFLEGLTKKDKIGILCHNDLDGVASAIILNLILKNKKLKPKFIYFMECQGKMFSPVIKKLEKKKINKLLIADLAVDTDYEGYKQIRKNLIFLRLTIIDLNMKTKRT